MFTRVQALEGTSPTDFRVEPHVAEQVFLDMLGRRASVSGPASGSSGLGGARVIDRRITSVTTGSGRRFAATVFIDASYEGDLLADAGVSFRLGRESRAATGETFAGARSPRRMFRLPAGSSLRRSPRCRPGHRLEGPRNQDSNFRLCLSSDPADRIAITAPDGYRATDYSTATAYAGTGRDVRPVPALDWVLMLKPIPNGKVDVNGVWAPGEPGPARSELELPRRERHAATSDRAAHERWTRGLLHFLRTDPGTGDDPDEARGLRLVRRRVGRPRLLPSPALSP